MEICWDNLEKLEYKNGKWSKDKKIYYIYMESCKECNKPYLSYAYKTNDFCSLSCSMKFYYKNNEHWNLGKCHSKETKIKIGLKSKGRKIHSKERKEFLRKYMTVNNPMKKIENKLKLIGENNPIRRNPDLSYFNINNPMKKDKYKKIISEKQIGENNSNWKGGISCEPYCEQWRDKEYKESIKERDGYKCLNPYCNKTINKLCIHHIDYNKKNCHPSNLITTCISCNGKANKDRRWHKAWYKAIINRRYKYA